MVRLGGRVRSLERRAGAAGPCRVCRGRGAADAVLEVGGRLERPPRGCPGCGRVGRVKRIILAGRGAAREGASP